MYFEFINGWQNCRRSIVFSIERNRKSHGVIKYHLYVTRKRLNTLSASLSRKSNCKSLEKRGLRCCTYSRHFHQRGYSVGPTLIKFWHRLALGATGNDRIQKRIHLRLLLPLLLSLSVIRKNNKPNLSHDKSSKQCTYVENNFEQNARDLEII